MFATTGRKEIQAIQAAKLLLPGRMRGLAWFVQGRIRWISVRADAGFLQTNLRADGVLTGEKPSLTQEG
jgi:hypothetical protein